VWRIPGLRRLRRLRLTRYWRVFFYSLVVFAIAGALLVWLAADRAGLFLLTLYSIPANSILPVPHEPGVLFFARYYHPAWIAVAATAGSAAACLADYALVESLLRHPRINGAREARLYKWAVKWLMRFPFWTIVAFTLVPVLPLYVARILAPASGYPLWRYAVANSVGRFPRFLGLAWVGHAFHFPGWLLLGMFVLLLAFLYLASRNTAGAGLDDEEEVEGEEILVPDLTDPENPKPGVSATNIPKMAG